MNTPRVAVPVYLVLLGLLLSVGGCGKKKYIRPMDEGAGFDDDRPVLTSPHRDMDPPHPLAEGSGYEVESPLDLDVSAVTIIYFLDLQNPMSAEAVATLDELVEEYSPDVLVKYHHAPDPMHPQALRAAIALESTKYHYFPKMLDWLLDNREQMREHDDDFEQWVREYAVEELGMSDKQFRSQAATHRSEFSQVARDIELGEELGVNQSPYYFINGIRLAGLQPKEVLVEHIEAERRVVGALMEKYRTTPRDVYLLRLEENYRASSPQPKLPPTKEEPEDEAADRPEPYVDTSEMIVLWEQAKGPVDALVDVLFFGAIDSPESFEAWRNLEAAWSELDAPVKLAFKHFSPEGSTRVGRTAARAAIIAGKDRKYWEMLDYLFERQALLPAPGKDRNETQAPFYIAAAKEIGMSEELFTRHFMEEKTGYRRLGHETREGRWLDIREAPVTFIDGRRVVGVKSKDEYIDLLRDALAEKSWPESPGN